MNKFYYLMLTGVLSSLSMVASTKVVFDKKLLEGKDDRFAKVVSGKADLPVLGDSKKLRFLYLLPKLGSDLKDGFVSGHSGNKDTKLSLEEGEHVTELFGVSDCKTWLGYFMGVFSSGSVHYRVFFGDKGSVKPGDYKELVDFVKGKLTLDSKKELHKVVPSHVFTHMLLA